MNIQVILPFSIELGGIGPGSVDPGVNRQVNAPWSSEAQNAEDILATDLVGQAQSNRGKYKNVRV